MMKWRTGDRLARWPIVSECPGEGHRQEGNKMREQSKQSKIIINRFELKSRFRNKTNQRSPVRAFGSCRKAMTLSVGSEEIAEIVDCGGV